MHPIKKNITKDTKCQLKTGHWKLDLKTKKRKWSKGIYSIFELEPGSKVISLPEIKNKYVYKDDLELFTTNINKLNKGKGAASFNYRIVVGGKIKHLFSSFCFGGFKKGIATRITGYITDMTQWVNLENKHKTITEQAGEAIFIGNEKGYIEDTNRKARELTGYLKEELLNFKIIDFFTKESLIANPLRFDLLDQGKTVERKRELVCKGAITIPIEMVTTKLSDGRYLAIVRDISERVRLETVEKEKSIWFKEQLDKANRRLIVQTLEISEKDKLLFDIKKCLETQTNRNPKVNDLMRQVNSSVSKQKTNEYFRVHFEEVHPGFFTRLGVAYPALTSGDSRLCACLRMNMTSKEISMMAGISVAAVHKSRNRLRKKMTLPGRIDLVIFMQNI